MTTENNNSSKGKGKAREEDVRQPIVEKHDGSNQRGLTERIAASANGLARSIVGPGAANSTLSEPYGSFAAEGKGQSSRGPQVSQNALETSIRDASQGQAFPMNGSATTPSSHENSFRTTEMDDPYLQQELADFNRDPSLEQALHVPLVSRNGEWLPQFGNETPNFDVEVPLHMPYQSNGHVHHAELQDGIGVLDLLSDPTFSPGADLYEVQPVDQGPEPDASDLFGENFNADEALIAQSIQSTLPAPPVHKPLPIDRPLNLMPAEVTEVEDKERFAQEWLSVLSNYADEVWGDALPQVKVAQEQLQQVAEGKRSLDSKAVARLKMIMGHLQENSASLPPLLSGSGVRQHPSSGRSVPSEATFTPMPVRDYECPDPECAATFPSNERWTAHIKASHQNLLVSPPIPPGTGGDWREQFRRGSEI